MAPSEFGMQVNGSAGNRPSASGDSGNANFQSDWKSFLEALGAAAPGPAEGKAGSTTSSTSSSIAAQSQGGDTVGMVQAPTSKLGSEPPSRFTVEREVDAAGGFVGKKLTVSDHASPARDIGRPREKRNKEISNVESNLTSPGRTSSTALQAVAVQVLVPEQQRSGAVLPGERKLPAAFVESSAADRDSLSGTKTKEGATQRGDLQTCSLRPDAADSSKDGIAIHTSQDSTDTESVVLSSPVNQNLRGSSVPTQLDSMEPGREIRASSLVGNSVSNSTQPTTMISPLNVATLADKAPATRTNFVRNVRPVESTAERSVFRAAHAGGAHEIEGEGRLVSQRQPGLTEQNAMNSTLSRDTVAIAAMSDGQGSAGGTGITAHAEMVDGRRLASNDTFAALDAGRDAPAPTWIHAGARHAEAGYLDPALGWVGVRADTVGGVVHAAVMPGSNEAAQLLGSHLAGLNNYLAEHHGQHATVTLATPQEGRGASSADQGSGSGEANTGRGGADQGSKDIDGGHAQAVSATAVRAIATTPISMTANVSVQRAAGNHISVMA